MSFAARRISAERRAKPSNSLASRLVARNIRHRRAPIENVFQDFERLFQAVIQQVRARHPHVRAAGSFRADGELQLLEELPDGLARDLRGLGQRPLVNVFVGGTWRLK